MTRVTPIPRIADQKIKVRYADLLRLGIVGSRFDLMTKIKQGRIRKPHKDGDDWRSPAWWWAHEIDEDLAAELERTAAE
ncbi:hypothetical protein [Sinorhizobium medicae]|uniref:hypothetical protein n=1 Tax=Sinorhizobium medicae TaxID=110321 RepID=UPI000FE03175|nr:hypothetical protein [Sinorhizobium medicae]RVJ00931.1 hypothetical protein CN183_26045 [Sinorhizobium medicae]